MHELIHCGDSGSWCYKRDKRSGSEAMVNRILQKGYEQGMAPLGRMMEIGGCGFQAFAGTARCATSWWRGGRTRSSTSPLAPS
eukprot:10041657-Alexandrium_andersonii.AAC.1